VISAYFGNSHRHRQMRLLRHAAEMDAFWLVVEPLTNIWANGLQIIPNLDKQNGQIIEPPNFEPSDVWRDDQDDQVHLHRNLWRSLNAHSDCPFLWQTSENLLRFAGNVVVTAMAELPSRIHPTWKQNRDRRCPVHKDNHNNHTNHKFE